MRRRIVLLVLSVVTLLVLVLYFTPLMGVRSVRVSGSTSLKEPEVLAAAQVPLGRSMFRVDTDEIRSRLRQDPKVSSARVELSWPSTVRLDVTERAPAAFLAVPGGFRLVDLHGVLFATTPAPPAGLPELRVPSAAPNEPTARAAMGVLASLPPDLRSQTVAVTASTPRDVRLQLSGEREIDWGEAKQSDRKAAILPLLLSRAGKVYDVTSPSLPTVS